ncbi:hypothetical protein QCA50_014132 [Cerrena zonata]|uniref:Uncharacterized protein n=1 Tax=Cerrena zonata TaxID=2478898 RepID=A0AAW0FX34_9APHY
MEESILQKWHHRSLELRERQHQEALQAEQIEGAGGEGEDAGTNAPQDVWQYCEIIEGKWESGKFEWPHMKLGKPNAPAISSIAVSHDAMLVAGGYEDGSIYVWRMDTGMLAFKLTGHASKDVGCMAFSPDSRNLSAGASSGKVMVWDVELEK